ncbi:ABC transporter permease subunit [Brevibacillus dissolubilis]|uniref:ABC transporter permease subunit n=1 Tax=Brevibacillus dissolubilis TaxID=1844116 RepID=UPI0011172560|nr:ABC transporter permease subunit [Brevibacillus dissolubilis]
MWTIAKMSFREILSKRIFLITIFMTIAFLLLYGTATFYAAKEAGENGMQDVLEQSFFSTQLLGMGLYFSSFIVSLLAILSSVSSISSEIESHQIDTWLARPLSRSSFVMGKFIGQSMLMLVYAAVLFVGIILLNQWLGGTFLRVDVSMGQVVKALSVFLLQPLIIIIIGLLLSSLMSTINGGIVLIILYGIGFIGGFIEQLGAAMGKVALQNIGIVSSLLFPIDSLFRKMTVYLFDSADDPFSFAAQGIFGSLSTPSNMMLAYIAVYGLVALGLAMRNFSTRDV